jgi:PEP-CTERM motif
MVMTTQSARWLKPFIILIALWIQPFWIQQVVAQTDPLEWKFTPPGPGPYYDPTTLTFEIPGYETDIEWYYSAADDVTLSSYYRDADGNWVITLDSPSFLSPVYVSPTPDNSMPTNAFWDYPPPTADLLTSGVLTTQPVIPGYVAAGQNIPEPATWVMMLLGFVGLAFGFRQSRRSVSLA